MPGRRQIFVRAAKRLVAPPHTGHASHPALSSHQAARDRRATAIWGRRSPPAEADIPALNFFLTKPGEFVTGRATDWVAVGYLLRRRLGWDGTYPDFPGDDGTYPDFPQVPDIP